MSKPKGKTPSLIGGSLGRPEAVTAGRLTYCKRCGASIVKGEKCYDVPKLSRVFSSPKRFCSICFKNVLEQTKHDLAALEAI